MADIIFDAVNKLIRYSIMNAYYKDNPNEDICSTLTGIKAIHWINEPLVCEEFIDKHIASITTTVFFLCLCFVIIIWISYLYPNGYI